MNCANHPNREHVAFCQNCGKPLCTECSRTVGNAVFCEPCLAARLAAAESASSSANTPYGNVSDYTAPPPPQPMPGAPNPALAGLLGFIPGVGAMYNGQYAKGIVHLVIFAVLVSLSDTNGIFGLFVAGWVFYQVIEAHHTARARRDGTPLPNPFGLNDIAERFGFGKSWPAAAPAAPPPPAGAAPQPPASTPFTQASPVPGTQSFTGSDGSFFAQAPYGQTAVGSDGSFYTQTANGGQHYGGPGTYSAWAPVGGGYPPIPPVPGDFDLSGQKNRFPGGAILLIALGVFFFIGSSGWFHHFPVHRILPFLLIGVGVWIFISRMTSTGLSVTDDGSPAYRYRLLCALRGAIWIVLVGVLFFLDSFGILSWGHSWPFFIIVAGLMMVLRRSTYAAMPAYAYPTPGPTAPYTPAPTASSPATPFEEEGK